MRLLSWGPGQEVDVAACFPELLRWVRELWTPCEEEAEPEPPQILALNSTHHQGEWVALVVGVAYHQHALPVAWHVVAAHARESWTGHFCRLLRQLAPAVPDRTPVHVLCDQGAGQGVDKVVSGRVWPFRNGRLATARTPRHVGISVPD